VKQGGRRKGANMGILNIDHPDIVEFIDSKQEEGKLSNFNLSVSITDEFMNAVIDDKDFDLIDNRLKKVGQTVKARDLFNKIVERLHNNGEPGIIFIDTINNTNPLPELGRIEATNPCSEQPLLPYESCNLGSINLVKLVKEVQDTSSSYKREFDWEGLAETVKWSVRFLDCVISVNKLPFKEIEDATLRTRKIGLGVMGFADTLLLLGIKYDSEEALIFADKLMEYITYYSRLESSELAKELDPFPAFEKLKPFKRIDSLWDVETLDWNMLDIQIRDYGLRNACITTIAPTGSISLIAGVSSAIEPIFQWKYTYNRVDQTFTEYHYLAKPYLDNNKELPDYFVTALDIKPEWHIKMQATFQKWIDSGISKTINLSNNATKEDVYNSIILAWKLGCKGITVYRTGSREKEVLVVDKIKEEIVTTKIHPRKRPEITIGKTIKVPVGDCGHLYVTINSDEKGPCEVFVKLGKSGGCVSSHAESLGRIISAALRSGVDVTELIEQLKNIRCSKVAFHNGTTIKSCSDGIAYALKKILDIEDVQDDSVISIGDNPECPECGSDLKREGKCLTCTDPSCGYSKCV
jgi:ribonucleoside-diphosphate reductase alpha chain